MSIAGGSAVAMPFPCRVRLAGRATPFGGDGHQAHGAHAGPAHKRAAEATAEKASPEKPLPFLGQFVKTLWRTKSELVGCSKSSHTHVHGSDDEHAHPEGEPCSHTGKAHAKPGPLKFFVRRIAVWFKDFWHILAGDLKILFRDTPLPKGSPIKP